MNYRFLFLSLSLFYTFLSCIAQNISGRWVSNRFSSTKITLDLIQQDDSVTGIGFIEFNEKIGSANVAIEGTFRNGIFEYQTKEILEQNIDSNYLLCFVSGREILKVKKNKYILEGECVAIDKQEECLNLSGLERYTKKVGFQFRGSDFIDRKVLVVDTITVKQDSIELLIWDNMKEDGDIVSVYLNEEIILANYLLRNQALSVKMDCKNGFNEILFYAHNIGSEPPNTATIAIKQNGKTIKTIDIKSDANKSESFVIMKM